ncbi:MAG: primosomal protein N' [Chloroflexi bacterium]|nr:primosomal protein N' [Chloroflexota bacterium]
MFAEVVPHAPVASAFTYRIPPELEGHLSAGHLVQINFNNQLLQGIVVGLTDELPEGLDEPALKPIDALIDSQPVLTRHQLDLAYYISHRWLAPLADCLFLMLPPGLARQGDMEYELLDVTFDAETDLQYRIFRALDQRGPLRASQLERDFKNRNWRYTLDKLVKLGVVKKRPILKPPSATPKRIRTVRLLIPPTRLSEAKLRIGYSPLHADILEYLLSLYPGQPAVADLVRVLKCSEGDLEPLVYYKWIEVTSPEPVIAATYPVEIMQKWIAKHEHDQPQETAILRALCDSSVVAVVQLPITPALRDRVIDDLNKRDLIRYSVNPPRVILNLTGAQVAWCVEKLRRPRHVAVLDYLAQYDKPVPVSWVYAETSTTLATLKEIADQGLIDLGGEEIMRDPLAGKIFTPTEPPTLTPDQRGAWEAIDSAFALAAAQSPIPNPPFLLHGVTGSGKTEIYLRAVARALELNRRAIALVPEIALTPQTVQRFASRFAGRVAVIHSELSEGERYDTWRRCRSGAVDVIIGARSALFAPLPDLGLIILDEEHDEAYQQDPPFAPHYHAREVAVEYARRLNAVCILGTATPDVVTFAKAKRGDYRLLELPQRIMAHGEYIAQLQISNQQSAIRSFRLLDPSNLSALYADLPAVSIIDMRNELRAGNRSIFSRALQTALSETLGRNEQAILFLNRRGQSTFVFCRDCGYVLACSRCGTPLIYHGNESNLQCHHCGATRRQPQTCPQCKGKRIKYFGAGTELVENEFKRLFPEAQTLRWDRDTARGKGAHEILLRHFRDHQADVLIGTQMIAKGLDLPLVTLVGVVSADVGLNLPDYRAAERVFQILTQVAGRAGRSALGGRVVVQSYQPDHDAVEAASRHDYDDFFEKETSRRKKLGYPPFGRIARLLYRHRKADVAEVEAQRVAEIVRGQIKKAGARTTALIGPAPCFFERTAGEYRWHIILRGPDPAELLRGLALKDWRVEVDPLSLL